MARFLLDNNVPDSIGHFLEKFEHDVVRLRDIMPVDTADPIVAEAAIRDKRILLSWDKDFGQQRFRKARYAELRRIGFSCLPQNAVNRLTEVMDIMSMLHLRELGFPFEVRIAEDKILIRDQQKFT